MDDNPNHHDTAKPKHSVAYGKRYISGLLVAEERKFDLFDADFAADSQADFALLGTALSVTFQISTCHNGCRGGDHILEALVGRTYNLASGAFLLITRGYYDESLCLVRSAGEISNLLMLFTHQGKYEEWVTATTSERMRNFQPKEVRKLLKNSFTPMSSEWYSELCEKAAHVTPDTVPNLHNSDDTMYVGGIQQQEGFRHCVEQLAMIAVSIAMITSGLLSQPALHEKMLNEIKSAPRRDGGKAIY